MADYYWKGGSGSNGWNTAANWVNSSNVAYGSPPSATDDVYFDDTGGTNCVLDNTNLTARYIYIQSNFGHSITMSGLSAKVEMNGLQISKAAVFNLTAATEFEMRSSSSGFTSYVNSSSTTSNNHYIRYLIDSSPFANDTSRLATTYDFNSKNYCLVDGVYPTIDRPGNLEAKAIFKDTSGGTFNSYGSVDLHDFTNNEFTSTSTNPDVFDYDKQFYFEGRYGSDSSLSYRIGENFKFGHTTVIFRAGTDAQGGHFQVPVKGDIISSGVPRGNTTTNVFNVQYHKVIIRAPPEAAQLRYCYIEDGRTLECNELLIESGGRLYGPAEGEQVASSKIKSVKRPTIQGDWNFKQIADGIYESIDNIPTLPVTEGGTGLNIVEKAGILYGDGQNSLGVLSLGTATQVLKVNDDETAFEWGQPEHLHIQVRNDEGATIPVGAPLYSKGEIGGSQRIKVGIADAGDANKMPCIGIANAEMNTTSTKDALATVGGVYNTNLTGFTGLSEGEIVYVKNWSGTPTSPSDVLTTTKPTGASELVQNVGIILKTNGTIIQGLLVSVIGRTNDVPNTINIEGDITSNGNISALDGNVIANTFTAGYAAGDAIFRTYNTGDHLELQTYDAGTSAFVTELEILNDQGGIQITNDLTVSGNLTVSGTTTTLDTTNLNVEDKNITLNYATGDTSSSANGAGITIQDAVDASTDATILWDASNDKFDFSHKVNVAGQITASTEIQGSQFRLSSSSNRIGLPATNEIAVFTNGSERMRFDSSGNVGIGTTSPSTELEVAGSITVTGDNEGITFDGGNKIVGDHSADGLQIRNNQNEAIVFKTNGNNIRMSIEGDGNVGIGTTSPDAKLHVEGSVLIDAYEAGAGAGLFFREGFLNTNQPSITVQDHSGANPDGLAISAYDGISFRLDATEKARFDSSGRLGIGTTSPSANLHVDRGTVSAASLTYGASSGQIFTNENSEFAFGLHNASPYPLYIQGRTHTNGSRQIVLNPLGGNIGIGALDADDAPLHIKSTGTSTTLLLESTDAGAADAPILELFRNSSSPANGDEMGQILWSGEKSDSSKYSVTKMYAEINTVDSSDRLMINIASSGGSGLQDFEYMRFDGGVRDVIINEFGQDIDFRIEGDSDTALFFTDASSDRIGIGTTSPESKLEVVAALAPSSATQFSYAETLKLDVENSGTAEGPAIRFRHGATNDHNAADYMFQVMGDGGSAVSHEYSFNYGWKKWHHATGADGFKPVMRFRAAGDSSASGTQYGEFIVTSTATAWDVYDGTHTGLEPSTYDTQIKLSGGEASYINNGQNFGIGTTSPAFPLEVNGFISTASGIVHTGDTNNTISFGTDTQSFNTAGSTRMHVTSAGDVGIGTTSPEGVLEIEQATTTGHALKVYRNQTASNMDSSLVLLHDDSQYADEVTLHVKQDGTGYAGIFEGGNVGIGTTSPSYPLHIDTDVTNPALDTTGAFSLFINQDLSGSSATGGDREQGGIYVDVDSSTTGGDTSDEHRAYGVWADVRLNSASDSDLLYGMYGYIEGQRSTGSTTGTTSAARAGYFFARSDETSDYTISELTGVYGYASLQDSGTVPASYGVRGFANVHNSRTENLGGTHGGFFEIDISSGRTNGDDITLGDSEVVHAVFDHNCAASGEGKVAIGNAFLFRGAHSITDSSQVTTAHGVYITGEDSNYFSGKVGIGTTSPVSELDLSTGALSFSNTNTQLKLSGGSNVDLQLGHWGNTHILIDTDGNDSSRYFAVSHGNATAGSATELMRVQENGKVGIGTTSPDRLLEITEQGTGAAYLRLSSTNTSYPNDTIFGGIEFYNADASGAGVGATIDALSNGSGRGGYLQFRTDENGSGSPSVRMTIDENGDVGIGTTSPTDTLSVNGGVAIGRFVDFPSNNTGTGASDPQLRIAGRGDGDNEPGIIQLAQFDGNNFFGGTAARVLGKLQFAMNENSNDVTTVAEIRGITSDPATAGDFDGALKFFTSQGSSSSATLTEKMILNSDGKLGIGTTSPDGVVHIKHTDNTGVPALKLETDASASPSDCILRIQESHGSDTFVDFTVNTFGQLEITGGGSTRRQIFTADEPDTDNLGVISLNKDHYEWDTQIFGDSSTPVIYVDGTNNRMGVSNTNPVSTLDIGTGGIFTLGNTRTALKLTNSEADLQLSHKTNAHILIDSDNTTTDSYFSVRKDSLTASAATELLRVNENGTIKFNNAYDFPNAAGSTGDVLQLSGTSLAFASQTRMTKPAVFMDNGTQNITTSLATVEFNTEVLDAANNASLVAAPGILGAIALSAAGYYRISYSIPINDDGSSGADRTRVFCYMQTDDNDAFSSPTKVAQSSSQVYTREASGGSGLSTSFIYQHASEGDRIRIIIGAENSTDISTESGESQISIEYLGA